VCIGESTEITEKSEDPVVIGGFVLVNYCKIFVKFDSASVVKLSKMVDTGVNLIEVGYKKAID
jgi:hypothetical protein